MRIALLKTKRPAFLDQELSTLSPIQDTREPIQHPEAKDIFHLLDHLRAWRLKIDRGTKARVKDSILLLLRLR